MEILVFTIKGKLAHFRKYYANNTAFSFTIPPRTTLMGIVAAIMGWQRDTYYEALSSENIRFGIRVVTPLKKSFQRLNFLSLKSLGDISKSFDTDFRGRGGRIQTPFEIVSGLNLVKDEVAYQVFISFTPQGKQTFEQIKSQLLNSTPVYNLSLGAASFQASINNVRFILGTDIIEQQTSEFVHLHSAIPSKLVQAVEFEKEEWNRYNAIEEDMMPSEFIANNNREVKAMTRLLFSTTNAPLRIKLNSPFFQVKVDDELVNIQFMEI